MNLKDTLKKSKGLKKSQGGSITVTIDGEDVSFDEDKFMKLFDKEDTKKVLLDAIRTGRNSDPEQDYKSAMWRWNDQGREEGKEPSMPEPASKDIPAPPEPISAEPSFEKSDFQAEDQARQVQAPRSEAAETPQDKVMAQKGVNPYEKKDEYEEITPENYRERLKTASHKFKKYYDAKYGKILNEVDPVQAANNVIAKNERSWAEDFFKENGHSDWSFDFIPERRKDPENRELFHEFDRMMTTRKQGELNKAKAKYLVIQQQGKDELFGFMSETQKVQKEMKEKERLMKEEAEKVTPDEKIKNMENLQKTLKALQEAKDLGDLPRVEILMKKIEILKEKAGNEAKAEGAVAATGKYGIKNEDEIKKYLLEEENLSEEDANRYLKHTAGKKQ